MNEDRMDLFERLWVWQYHHHHHHLLMTSNMLL